MNRIWKSAASIFLAMAMCCTLAACEKPESIENDITVKSTYNTLAVERSEEIGNMREGIFEVSAAAGETDGAQIIVRPKNRVANYTAEVGDLVAADGSKIAKENLTLYVQIYARVTNGTNDFPAGYYPDCLIPFEYIEDANENFIEAGQNQGFWLDVAVPEGTAAGDYVGYVKFGFDSEEISIPVSTTVFDFTIPSVPTIETSYLIWRNWLIYGELDATVEKWKTYFDFLLEYNLCGYDLPVEIGDIEGYKAAVREYYPKLAAFFIPFKIEGNLEIDTDLMEQYIYAIAEISLEDNINYFDKAKYYIHTIYDECNHDAVKPVRYPKAEQCLREVAQIEDRVVERLVEEQKISDAQGEFAQSIRDIPHVMTTTYEENFAENFDVDTFCPSYNNFITSDSIRFYQDLMEQGLDIYSYSAANRGVVGSQLINDYTIAGRDIFWSKFAYGIKGDLFWNVTGYVAWWQFVGQGYGLLNDLYTQASHDGLSNGDGYMMYPGKQYNSEKPFPSLRLVMRRDGIDDYNYMSLLGKNYESLQEHYRADFDVRKSLKSVYDQIFSLSASKLNYGGLADMRALIADFIELSQSGAGFVVDEIEAGHDAIECTFYVKNGYEVTVNGVPCAGVDAGNGKRIRVNVPYGDKGILNVKVSGKDYSKTFTFGLGAEPAELNDFAGEKSLNAVSVSNYGSAKAVNMDPAYSLNGMSAEIVLSGYIDADDTITSAFRPYVYFDVNGLAGTKYVEFEVYNASEEDFTVLVVALNNAVTYNLDEITLKSGEWTKIKVGNFTKISANGDGLNNIVKIGLEAKTNLINQGKVYTRKLYVDELYMKQ